MTDPVNPMTDLRESWSTSFMVWVGWRRKEDEEEERAGWNEYLFSFAEKIQKRARQKRQYGQWFKNELENELAQLNKFIPRICKTNRI